MEDLRLPAMRVVQLMRASHNIIFCAKIPPCLAHKPKHSNGWIPNKTFTTITARSLMTRCVSCSQARHYLNVGIRRESPCVQIESSGEGNCGRWLSAECQTPNLALAALVTDISPRRPVVLYKAGTTLRRSLRQYASISKWQSSRTVETLPRDGLASHGLSKSLSNRMNWPEMNRFVRPFLGIDYSSIDFFQPIICYYLLFSLFIYLFI